MVDTVIASFVSFVSTNIDDIFLLMILCARVTGKIEERKIFAGRYVGTGMLLAVSFLGIWGLQSISGNYLKLLGVIPMVMGVRMWIDHRKKGETACEGEQNSVQETGVLTTALITISSGADNIGVYIPMFAEYGIADIIVVIAVFAVMTAVWNWLGKRLADLPLVRKIIQRYKDAVVAVVFIILGAYILFK